jgi:hypothetical protein
MSLCRKKFRGRAIRFAHTWIAPAGNSFTSICGDDEITDGFFCASIIGIAKTVAEFALGAMRTLLVGHLHTPRYALVPWLHSVVVAGLKNYTRSRLGERLVTEGMTGYAIPGIGAEPALTVHQIGVENIQVRHEWQCIPETPAAQVAMPGLFFEVIQYKFHLASERILSPHDRGCPVRTKIPRATV